MVEGLSLIADRLAAEDIADLRQLVYLERFDCAGPLTPALVESLAALPNLWKLGATYAASGPNSYPPMLTSSNANLLSRLPGLVDVDLCASELAPTDLPVLMKLPRLQTLRISGRQFLIEDLELLAEHPALRTIYARISATKDERQAFRDAHPKTIVHWIDLPVRNSLVAVGMSDPWHVTRVRIGRWSGANAAYAVLRSKDGILSQGGVTLTRKRLERIPTQILSEVNEIRLGRVDSAATAVDLIERCKSVEYVDARVLALDDRQIARLCRHRSLRRLLVQQGLATADQFCQLAEVPSLRWLEIYGSTFTREDAERIRGALLSRSPDAFVDVFRGPRDNSVDSVLYAEN